MMVLKNIPMTTPTGVPSVAPTTFNYAVSCTAFDLSESGVPKVYIVDYLVSETLVQKRLPGGRFQACDLLKSIADFILVNPNNREIAYTAMEVSRLEEKYNCDISGLTDYGEINVFFHKYTYDLLLLLQRCKSLTENDFAKILEQTILNTVRRELKEELNASHVGELHLSSIAKSGGHHKLGFTSVQVEAPTPYIGSPDVKILKSYLEPIDFDTQKSLFNGHSNNLSEGFRHVIQNKLHPNALDLKRFWKEIK